MEIRSLPKVELHLHLDCSLSFDVVRRLRPDVTRETFRTEYLASPKCRDLADFLTVPPRSVALLQSSEALRLATEDLFDQLAGDGVVYAEVRFAPLLHLERGLGPEQVVETVEGAMAEASARTGVEGRLILCTLRHFTEAQSLETARLAERFREGRVVALDLAGDEAGYSLDAHVTAFEYAAEHGVHRTAHAGEGAGPASVWETLERLRPARIGHGVRSIEDPALLERLKRDDIHLEVCPTCNVQIDLYDTYADHPIDRLRRAGISVGVNTDARTVPNVTLVEEYERLRETFGWGAEDFLAVNLDAARVAFLPAPERAVLEARLQAAYLAAAGAG
ncbi:MAG: adenosine deaminase [Gemmatimonadota bacterium]